MPSLGRCGSTLVNGSPLMRAGRGSRDSSFGKRSFTSSDGELLPWRGQFTLFFFFFFGKPIVAPGLSVHQCRVHSVDLTGCPGLLAGLFALHGSPSGVSPREYANPTSCKASRPNSEKCPGGEYFYGKNLDRFFLFKPSMVQYLRIIRSKSTTMNYHTKVSTVKFLEKALPHHFHAV